MMMDNPYVLGRVALGALLIFMGGRGYLYGLNDLQRFPRNLTGTPAWVATLGYIVGGWIVIGSALVTANADAGQFLTITGLLLPLPVHVACVIVYSRAHPEVRRPPEKQSKGITRS